MPAPFACGGSPSYCDRVLTKSLPGLADELRATEYQGTPTWGSSPSLADGGIVISYSPIRPLPPAPVGTAVHNVYVSDHVPVYATYQLALRDPPPVPPGAPGAAGAAAAAAARGVELALTELELSVEAADAAAPLGAAAVDEEAALEEKLMAQARRLPRSHRSPPRVPAALTEERTAQVGADKVVAQLAAHGAATGAAEAKAAAPVKAEVAFFGNFLEPGTCLVAAASDAPDAAALTGGGGGGAVRFAPMALHPFLSDAAWLSQQHLLLLCRQGKALLGGGAVPLAAAGGGAPAAFECALTWRGKVRARAAAAAAARRRRRRRRLLASAAEPSPSSLVPPSPSPSPSLPCCPCPCLQVTATLRGKVHAVPWIAVDAPPTPRFGRSSTQDVLDMWCTPDTKVRARARRPLPTPVAPCTVRR